VIPDPIQQGLPDLPTNAFFEYGVYEGIPRILDLFDKHKIKMSSFMIGHAVDKAPDLAREIVKRGHEAGRSRAHLGKQLRLDPTPSAASSPMVWRALKRSPVRSRSAGCLLDAQFARTLDILQSLGFVYHIDEPSAMMTLQRLPRRRRHASPQTEGHDVVQNETCRNVTNSPPLSFTMKGSSRLGSSM